MHDALVRLGAPDPHAAIAESADGHFGRAARGNVTITAITRTDSWHFASCHEEFID
jgi:hypothetical protein